MKALTLLSVFLCLSTLLYGQGPVEWNKSESYTHPSLVMHNSVSYLSLKNVDSGIEITNTEFWKTLDQLVPTEEPAGQDSLPDSSTFADGVDALEDPPPLDTASGLTSATNEAFVMQQYLDFLGRDGDSEGITYWTEQLDTGVQSRADCVNNFVFSAEFQQQVAPVSRLYLAYFLRLPDTGGLTYWIDEKLNGMTLNEISNSFAGVQEFSDRYGSLDDSGFVNLVYNNVLSRNPDSEGLSYWNGEMSGGMTRGEVMTGFSESTENQNSTLNQIRVIAFYYGMLKRAPDQGGFDYWVGKLNNGELPNELIDGFIISPEYQGRAEKSASEGGFGK